MYGIYTLDPLTTPWVMFAYCRFSMNSEFDPRILVSRIARIIDGIWSTLTLNVVPIVQCGRSSAKNVGPVIRQYIFGGCFPIFIESLLELLRCTHSGDRSVFFRYTLDLLTIP